VTVVARAEGERVEFCMIIGAAPSR